MKLFVTMSTNLHTVTAIRILFITFFFVLLSSNYGHASNNEIASHTDFNSPLVNVASDSAIFNFSLPEAGCVSIWVRHPGKNDLERVWGPQLMKSGKFRLALPASKIKGKSGIIELFSVELIFDSTIGRAGKGERQFMYPCGICYDRILNEIYVADTGNDRIVRLSAEGKFIAQYGGFGVTFGDRSEEREDSFDEPWDVAVGGFSNLYVSDQNNNRICEFDAYKKFRGTFFPNKDDKKERLNRPKGITIDTENNLWVVDSRNDRILKISPTGGKVFEIGRFGWGKWQFKDPTQIAVDNYGNVFIVDRGNRRIQVFDRLGSHLFEIKDHLLLPTGVAVANDGLIYVCDEKTNELSTYLANGNRLQVLNGISPTDLFKNPTDIAISDNKLFLVDAGNHRIVVFSRNKRTHNWSWHISEPVLK